MIIEVGFLPGPYPGEEAEKSAPTLMKRQRRGPAGCPEPACVNKWLHNKKANFLIFVMSQIMITFATQNNA